jgi:hypothetical protein
MYQFPKMFTYRTSSSPELALGLGSSDETPCTLYARGRSNTHPGFWCLVARFLGEIMSMLVILTHGGKIETPLRSLSDFGKPQLPKSLPPLGRNKCSKDSYRSCCCGCCKHALFSRFRITRACFTIKFKTKLSVGLLILGRWAELRLRLRRSLLTLTLTSVFEHNRFPPTITIRTSSSIWKDRLFYPLPRTRESQTQYV